MALPAAHPCFGPDNVEMVGLGIALGWRNSPASSCYEEPTKDTPRSDTRTLQEGRLPRRQGLLWVGLPAGPLVRPQPCWSHRRGGHPPPTRSRQTPSGRFPERSLHARLRVLRRTGRRPLELDTRRGEVGARDRRPRAPRAPRVGREGGAAWCCCPEAGERGRCVGVVLIISLMHRRSGRSRRSWCPLGLAFAGAEVH